MTPYWPFRCGVCSRFVSNPKVTLGPDRDNPYSDATITSELGDCARCGPQVPLKPLGWDDWFAEDFDPTTLYIERAKADA